MQDVDTKEHSDHNEQIVKENWMETVGPVSKQSIEIMLPSEFIQNILRGHIMKDLRFIDANYTQDIKQIQRRQLQEESLTTIEPIQLEQFLTMLEPKQIDDESQSHSMREIRDAIMNDMKATVGGYADDVPQEELREFERMIAANL